MYQIMNKDKDSFRLESEDFSYIEDYYENHKKFHISDWSSCYGDVLVKLKRVKSGISFRLSIHWLRWDWMPSFELRHSKNFHWLCFSLFLNFSYSHVFDRVIRDHLQESMEGDL